MTDMGKKLRMGHIFNPKTGKAVVMPMDQPLYGYHEALVDPAPLVRGLIDAGATAFLLARGTAKAVASELAGRAGLIYRTHVATAFSQVDTEYAVYTTVEEALRLGADAVAPCVFLGSPTEKDDLTAWGLMADACDKWGMPIFPEVHPPAVLPGAKVYDGPYGAEAMRLNIRIAAEIGADFIKTWYSGDAKSYKEILGFSLVPVLIAGGAPTNDARKVLEIVRGAMDAGAGGVSMGRKVWGGKSPFAMCRAVSMIIQQNATVDEALKEFHKK
jgi:fructose-bisphosphate aldolase/2-amino-3,7-dideoxy-D-threo-hept-6-ulosonate synthase